VGIKPFEGAARNRRSPSIEITSEEQAVVSRLSGAAEAESLSPLVLAYVVGPLALVVLLVFRHFGLVAHLPIWAYVAAIIGSGLFSVIVEPWHSAPAGSIRFQARLAIHILAVTTVIYMVGWGPALGMAYAFVAIQELQTWGSGIWPSVMCWSLANIMVAQYLIWIGAVPSFFSRGQAETIGALGACVLAIVIRMAGATGEKKERAEALLAHQALHDMLTGLPNRAFFYERTDDALGAAPAGSFSAVMLFDLDRFKEINDTMGHKYGDRVLIEVGPRVQTVLRGGDTLARLGGDEFCVLLPRVTDQLDAVRVAERIIGVLEEPFAVDGTNLGIEASCGISLAPDHGNTADLLLQRADVAMYAAKDSQDSVVVYTEDLNVNTPARLSLLGDLRNAVARNEFVLHYQPKASMRSRRVLGAEALIRWQHPTLGLLFPDSFIPEAERTGLIEPMTQWVLNDALRQCRRWLDLGNPAAPTELSIAVNLSTRSLLDVSLPEMVRLALTRWDVAPHLLDLEITETIIMTDPKRARRVLTELAEMGVTLSIDDFGTGYSSLAYLRDLPVHQLKIDRSFVQDMENDSEDAVIVRSVVDLARNLGLKTVAEGVEDASTWEQLTNLGCTSAQGYYLARPMPADMFWKWLEEDGGQVGSATQGADHRPGMIRGGGLTPVPPR
jgi:diguanylate cyclase (GGDEF)-like protein